MRTLVRLFAAASLLGALASYATAAAADANANTTSARLSLVAWRTEPTPQHSGRYSLRARFQREERAGELREGGDFVLLGRFAKAGVGCDANFVFRNGFEG